MHLHVRSAKYATAFVYPRFNKFAININFLYKKPK